VAGPNVWQKEGWLAFAFIAVGSENNYLLVIQNEYVRTINV